MFMLCTVCAQRRPTIIDAAAAAAAADDRPLYSDYNRQSVARHSRAHLQVHIATREMGTNQTWFGYEQNFAMPYDFSWYCGCDEVKLSHRLTPLAEQREQLVANRIA